MPDPLAPPPSAVADRWAWPAQGPWTRLAMLRCLDGGAAGADGRSRSVSSDADRRVLGGIRRLADAVVTGAGTMREEPYGPFLAGDGATPAERVLLGLAPAPRLVVVSASLDLPWEAPVFSGSALPVVVLTEPGAAVPGGAAARAEVVEVDGLRGASGGAAIVAALHGLGLQRVVCEGGPRLAATFAAADVVDEVDLTVAPWLGTQAPAVASAADPRRFVLADVAADDGFVFLRYLRRAGGPDPA
ncbi:MAG: dihydrofolate reductase family protein [Kineosporiaceae bacterium]